MRRRTQIISFTSVAQLHNLIPASSENVTKMRSLTVNHPVKSSMHCFIPKPGFCQIVKEAIESHFKILLCIQLHKNLLSQKSAFQIQSIFLIMEKLEMFLVVNWVQQGYDNGTECLKINKNGQNST